MAHTRFKNFQISDIPIPHGIRSRKYRKYFRRGLIEEPFGISSMLGYLQKLTVKVNCFSEPKDCCLSRRKIARILSSVNGRVINRFRENFASFSCVTFLINRRCTATHFNFASYLSQMLLGTFESLYPNSIRTFKAQTDRWQRNEYTRSSIWQKIIYDCWNVLLYFYYYYCY